MRIAPKSRRFFHERTAWKIFRTLQRNLNLDFFFVFQSIYLHHGLLLLGFAPFYNHKWKPRPNSLVPGAGFWLAPFEKLSITIEKHLSGRPGRARLHCSHYRIFFRFQQLLWRIAGECPLGGQEITRDYIFCRHKEPDTCSGDGWIGMLLSLNRRGPAACSCDSRLIKRRSS